MSKLHKIFTLLFFATATIGSNAQPAKSDRSSIGSDEIRLNQVGYYPTSIKKAVVVNSGASEFDLYDQSGKKVFSAQLADAGSWDKSGEKIKLADFSSFHDTGHFVLSVADKGKSFPFHIQTKVYNNALKAALKSYYYQRCSMALDAKYAGEFARAAGHPDTECFYHPSTGHKSGSKPSTKGWYDAGDYNKYTVNTGISLGMMLSLAELYPNAIPDQFSNIPESGNGMSDLLDEIKYELDWLQTMQDEDGGVFNKLTTLKFDSFEMPEKDKGKRYFVGKSTTAALDFAANTAQAYRVYRSTDKAYAEGMLKASQKAFEWAMKHPDIAYSNPSDVSTGAYDAKVFKDEFFWAASELYVATADAKYLDVAKKYQREMSFEVGDNWRQYLYALGVYTITGPNSPLADAEKTIFKNSLLKLADLMLKKTETIPYHIAVDDFQWGSNSDVMDASMLYTIAWRFTKEQKYMDAAIESTDYVFGKNAIGISFITGIGSKSTMHPHHRPSASDGIDQPVPGLMAGGPNAYRQDETDKPWGVKYPNHLPAKSYLDLQGSYASNEVAINWNAPLVFVLGFLESEVK